MRGGRREHLLVPRKVGVAGSERVLVGGEAVGGTSGLHEGRVWGFGGGQRAVGSGGVGQEAMGRPELHRLSAQAQSTDRWLGSGLAGQRCRDASSAYRHQPPGRRRQLASTSKAVNQTHESLT